MENSKNGDDTNTTVHQPHDKFFRTMMANKQVARSFLEAHLPSDLLKRVDLNNIEVQPRSYINDVGKETAVDVLFKTTIDGKEAYIYFLMEHQSRPDKLMSFRLLKYLVNVTDQHIIETGTTSLPLIYPVVIYHADKPYPYSTDIRDIVNAPRELIDRYFLQPFHLIDLGKIDDEEIKHHAWASIMEFALKHIFERDALPYIKDIAPIMRQIINEGGEKCVIIVLQYFMGRGEFSSKNDFIDLINKEISTDIGDKIMSLAEKIKAEGVQQGLQQGMLQGMQQGMQQGLERVACNLIDQGADLKFVANATGLRLEKIRELVEETKH